MHDLAAYGERVVYEPDPYRAAAGADALVLLTDWQVYSELDYARLYESMRKPAFLFDGRNTLEHERLFKLGFNLFAIGKTPLTHDYEPTLKRC